MTSKGKKHLPKFVADRNPAMASNRSQITVKRLACCNILESEIPTGERVSFENIVTENILDNTYLGDHSCVCIA